jgi:hypothetical protein
MSYKGINDEKKIKSCVNYLIVINEGLIKVYITR